MRSRKIKFILAITSALFFILALFSQAVVAEVVQAEQVAQAGGQMKMEGSKGQGGMMGQGMMGKGMMMMGKKMMARHQEIKKLVDQLTESLTAMEGENDLATIKKELAADRALLHQLQSTLGQGRNMMGQMMGHMKEHMKTCPMKKSETK